MRPANALGRRLPLLQKGRCVPWQKEVQEVDSPTAAASAIVSRGDDNLYLAGFSCFGPEIDAAGPGVGIVSSVPERHGLAVPHAAMSGTSMASPAVCGALAVLLARDAKYLSLPRDASRATKARSILRKACREIGLKDAFEGYGVPDLT